jgi:hypothetical protein
LQKLIQAPAKDKRWTLQQLAQRLVELGHAESICTLTVHKALKRIKAAAQQTELAGTCALPQPHYIADEQAA